MVRMKTKSGIVNPITFYYWGWGKEKYTLVCLFLMGVGHILSLRPLLSSLNHPTPLAATEAPYYSALPN